MNDSLNTTRRLNFYYVTVRSEGYEYRVDNEFGDCLGVIARNDRRLGWLWTPTGGEQEDTRRSRIALRALQSIFGLEHHYFESIHTTRPLRF